MKSLFDFTAGTKTTNPGAQRHIKSTVRIKDGILNNLMKSLFEFMAGIITLGSGAQRHIKSTMSKRDGIFGEILV